MKLPRARSPFQRRKTATDILDTVREKEKLFAQGLAPPAVNQTMGDTERRSRSRSPFRRRKKAFELLDDVRQLEATHTALMNNRGADTSIPSFPDAYESRGRSTRCKSTPPLRSSADYRSYGSIAEPIPFMARVGSMASCSSANGRNVKSAHRRGDSNDDIIKVVLPGRRERARKANESQRSQKIGSNDILHGTRKVDIDYTSSFVSSDGSVVEVQLDSDSNRATQWRTPSRKLLPTPEESPSSVALMYTPELQKRKSFRERFKKGQPKYAETMGKLESSQDDKGVKKVLSTRLIPSDRDKSVGANRSTLSRFIPSKNNRSSKLHQNPSLDDDSIAEVKTALMQMQKDLESVSSRGSKASRDLILKKLLKVADTLESKEDGTTMRRALQSTSPELDKSTSSSSSSSEDSSSHREEESGIKPSAWKIWGKDGNSASDFAYVDEESAATSNSDVSSGFSEWIDGQADKGLIDMFGLPTFWSKGSSSNETKALDNDKEAIGVSGGLSNPPTIQRSANATVASELLAKKAHSGSGGVTVGMLLNEKRRKEANQQVAELARKRLLEEQSERRWKLEQEQASQRKLAAIEKRRKEIQAEEVMMRELEQIDKKIAHETDAARDQLRRQLAWRRGLRENEQERVAIEVQRTSGTRSMRDVRKQDVGSHVYRDIFNGKSKADKSKLDQLVRSEITGKRGLIPRLSPKKAATERKLSKKLERNTQTKKNKRIVAAEAVASEETSCSGHSFLNDSDTSAFSFSDTEAQSSAGEGTDLEAYTDCESVETDGRSGRRAAAALDSEADTDTETGPLFPPDHYSASLFSDSRTAHDSMTEAEVLRRVSILDEASSMLDDESFSLDSIASSQFYNTKRHGASGSPASPRKTRTFAPGKSARNKTTTPMTYTQQAVQRRLTARDPSPSARPNDTRRMTRGANYQQQVQHGQRQQHMHAPVQKLLV